MIILFTDFGPGSLYVGQMHLSLLKHGAQCPIIDLVHDVPKHNVNSGAWLLAANVDMFPERAVVCCVVDPGVGSSQRLPVVVRAGSRWFVGPHNGLFDQLSYRYTGLEFAEIQWRPSQLSNTFHGRDLFAPVASFLYSGMPFEHSDFIAYQEHLPRIEDKYEIIYIDDFGNAMINCWGDRVSVTTKLLVNSSLLGYADTFSSVPPGQAFWTVNSLGLVEIAVNCGSVTRLLGLRIGTEVIFNH